MNSGRNFIYTYNHAGERAVKSHGSMEGVYINGAPQGITFHETDEYTLYPASIISVNKNRFTKHYFIGDKRVASRIGSGSFNNVYGQNGSFLTAGQQDYAERLNQIETQREDYYRELGIAPGIPTMKGSYGDPENTGVGYNTIIKELGDHTVPAEWAQYVKHNEVEGSAPGAPIQWDDPSDPESAQPGYGFIADNSGEPEETFYYHSDHLGSTSYITDGNGNITQYDAYLPYGELLVDEHSSSEEMPYKFNGKELDEETGLYYYGARYMNPITSIWYGVDPLTEEYAEISGYVYCHSNPIIRTDVDGLYDTLNIHKGENYPVIVVLPTNLDDVGKDDYNAAKKASMPILQVDNIKDLTNALSDFSNDKTTYGCVTFNSHGSIKGFSIGSDKVDLNTDLSSLEDGLKGKDVVINACKVGINDGLVGRIAEQTGATVYASKHKVFAGYTYNGEYKPHLNGKEGVKWTKAYSELDSGINLTARETVMKLSIHKKHGVKYFTK